MNFSREKMDNSLSSYLATRPEVVAAYLFGSRAEGVPRPDSDVDLALIVDPPPDFPLLYRLQLVPELQNLLRQEVDVVLFDQANPLLQFQIISKGILLYERDPDRRAVATMRALSRYYDYKRFHDFHMRYLGTTLKEGVSRG